MNPLIAALLGQQSSGAPLFDPVGTPGINPEANERYQGQIDVVGQGNKSIGLPYDDFALNNVPAVVGRQQDVSETEEASQRRGMFGVKGTLRDILGVVGDAFLIQSGNKAMYAPIRQQEKISDAMAGFTENPMAAAERVGYYNPEMGYEMGEDARDATLKDAQAQSLAANRQSMIDDRKFKKYERARAQIGSLFNTPGAVVNGQISPEAVALAERIAASADMTLEEFMINEGMTEEEVRGYAMSVIDPYKQERLEDYDRAGDQRDFSNQTGRISATRPRAAPRPRAETDREAAIRIGNKPPSERTQGERDFYEKYTRPPANRGSTPRRPSTSTKPSVSNW